MTQLVPTPEVHHPTEELENYTEGLIASVYGFIAECDERYNAEQAVFTSTDGENVYSQYYSNHGYWWLLRRALGWGSTILTLGIVVWVGSMIVGLVAR